jgi:hypothetical protein
MVNSEELIGKTKYLTLYTKCRINLCRYNRADLFCVCVCSLCLSRTIIELLM